MADLWRGISADRRMCEEREGRQHGGMHENRPNSRFGADVDYRGRAGRHDYVVRARHRLLGTTFTVAIDGVEHDPKAEEKARKAREGTDTGPQAGVDGADDSGVDGVEGSEADGADVGAADGDDDAAAYGDGDPRADGDDLSFTLQEGVTALRCTVRRPREDVGHKDAEVIALRTVGLGGAGEVEVRHGFQRTVLVPEQGSPSAARDAKRTAHPTRYALVAALTKSARYLLPLLGLGALFSGLLEPVEEWIEARLRPAVEAIVRATEPPREWIAQLLQPIRDLLAALLQPVRDLVGWLLGLLPDLELPFDVPGWLVDVLFAVIVVVVVFSATRRGLQERRTKLESTKATTKKVGSGEPGETADGDQGEPGETADGDQGEPAPSAAHGRAEQEATEPTVADRPTSGP